MLDTVLSDIRCGQLTSSAKGNSEYVKLWFVKARQS